MIVEPFLTWAPAFGVVLATVPASPPSTSWVLTEKPRPSSLLRAASSLRPATSGTGTVAASAPIVRLIRLPLLTLIPGAGSQPRTFPTWAGGPSTGVWAPTFRPSLVSSAMAAAGLCPISRGTVTWTGPRFGGGAGAGAALGAGAG